MDVSNSQKLFCMYINRAVFMLYTVHSYLYCLYFKIEIIISSFTDMYLLFTDLPVFYNFFVDIGCFECF